MLSDCLVDGTSLLAYTQCFSMYAFLSRNRSDIGELRRLFP